ncbi:hypothetical protein D9M70_592460 [compost metagenome]
MCWCSATWSAAAQFNENHALAPRDHGLSTQEALLRHLVHGLWAAQREGTPANEQETFLHTWLAHHSVRNN